MKTDSESATTWNSRHLANIFIHRRTTGCVVLLGHSEGITDRAEYFVPAPALRALGRRTLAACFRQAIRDRLDGLEGARRIPEAVAWALIQRPRLDRRIRWQRTPANWSGAGVPSPVRGLSGSCYLAAPSESGWLVLARSRRAWPQGAHLVPSTALSAAGGKWDPDFLLDPVRGLMAELSGAREITFDEAERMLGWTDLLLPSEARRRRS